jgi:hypothetical protein
MNTAVLLLILFATLSIAFSAHRIEKKIRCMTTLPPDLVKAGHDLSGKAQDLQDALDAQNVE